ncbi:MAG: GNAT family N-acetyltransferase [Bacilli bacterium]|nr:GNAT family N-acetyltransferase [Bacilli bacterium]
MNIEIKKLTPDLVEDYIHFFDVTPHDDFVDEHKCYCVCWSSDDCDGMELSTVAKRRAKAYDYIKNGSIQGYLAYSDGKVVGWCNANDRAKCVKCVGFRYVLDFLSLDDEKVKSVFCFTIAPEMKRKGIATALLERVCQDAKDEGYNVVEAYPYHEKGNLSSDFGGYVNMYLKCGFKLYLDTNKGPVMRKYLK